MRKTEKWRKKNNYRTWL